MTDARPSRLPAIAEEAPLVAEIFARLRAGGRRPLNLHRTLAHAPELLRGMLGLAEALRHGGTTSRRLRELVILRTAQLEGSSYELAQHMPMARAAGIEEAEIAALEHWRDSRFFDARERAALEHAESVAGNAPADNATLDRLFTPGEIVELTVTASFYLMTARVLRALDIKIEDPPALTVSAAPAS
jgi:AhpD family alkylhydroperoxidase